MKYLRFQLLAALLCLVAMVQAQSNVLRVEPVESPAGKVLILPVVMENQSDVTGVQFDIRVPYQLAKDSDGKVIVNLSKTRSNGHTVVTKELGQDWSYYTSYGDNYDYYYKYRIIVYSDNNALFLDNEGELLNVQLTPNAELPDEKQMTVYLYNVTLSDTQMQNVLTNATNGTIKIKEIPRPDLQPTDVTFTTHGEQANQAGPGQKIDVAWKVKNIGKAATNDGSGWSEEVSLVSGTVTKVMATLHHDGKLDPNEEVSRSAELTLPALPGIDGAAKVQVKIIPDATAGEHQTLRDNNTAQSQNSMKVTKQLILEISPQHFNESQYWQRVTIKLSRSGKWNNLQSFKVTMTNSKGEPSTDTRVPKTEYITIQPGEASALVYMSITNNDVLDPDTLVHFKIEDTEEIGTYAAVEGDLVIIDDELPALTVTPSKNELAEGTDKVLRLTVQTERAPEKNLAVTLTSENNKRFTPFPSSIIIPAGETTAQMNVTVVDDDVANGTLTNKFTASAAGHQKGETLVMITDDDLPTLQLTITPTQVQEGDGPISVAATLRRTSNINKKVTVKLSDDANGGLYFGNRTLEMPKGTEEVNFNFGPVDNQEVDGDRTYTITAAVWLSSCSCSATTGYAAGNVTAQLNVLDDDGKALRLASANGTVKEGGTTTLTVTRNTNDNSEPVTVNITSDYDTSLEYDHEVTIPAEEKSVDVEITSKKNDVPNDSHTVIFTVTAADYAKGTCWVMVTDQTLPDATITAIAASPESVKVGEPTTVTLTVSNELGNAVLPASTLVKIYASGEKDALANFTIDENLAIGETKTIEKSIMLPKSVGVKQLYAVVNETKAVPELSATNNTSVTINVSVESPFMATLQTDKQRYNQNEMINFTGQLTGKDFADAEVDLYVVCEGTRQVQRLRADANGAFSYKWLLTTALSGHAVAGVCYPDAGARDEITSFDIFGLRRYDTRYLTHELTVGNAIEAPVQLVNPGVLKLTGVKAEVVSKPDHIDIVELNIPQTIKGGASDALLTYKLVANKQSTGSEWDQVKLLITSNEGAELPITLYCYARMAKANLVTPNQRINTTMTMNEVREYPIQLINNGQGHTGELSLALPDWITCAQGSKLAGIEKGDTITLVLRFKPTDTMQPNVPVTGTIGFNVEYGNGTYANFSVTPVTGKTGTLEVEVADEYTYYTDEKPHVKDAEVVLRNAVTNAIVTQGKSGEDGLVTFEDLPEGYYKLCVTADNHDSYANNIMVDPGTTTRKIINLSVQAIKVSWTVEETEVEDVYDIVTTVTYETNVPAPVVETICPDRIPADSLAEGESLVFYAIMTNKGLINAENAELILPERTGIYLWEPLAENTGLTIRPQQSYIVPVKVTRITPTDSRMMRSSSDDSGCSTAVATQYKWKCGSDHKWHRYSRNVTYKVCPARGGGGVGGGGGGGGGGGLGSPGGGGGGGYGSSSNDNTVSIKNDQCKPCQGEWLEVIVDCVENFIPVYGCAKGVKQIADGKADALDGALTAVGCSAEVCAKFGAGVAVTGVGAPAGLTLAGACTIVGWVSAGLSCLKTVITHKCKPDEAPSGYSAGARRNEPTTSDTDTDPSYIGAMKTAGQAAEKSMSGLYDYLVEVFGDKAFVTDLNNDQIETLLAMAVAEKEELVAESLMQYKPDVITTEQFLSFIERVNNTRRSDADPTFEAENCIHADIINAAVQKIQDAEQMAVDAGYMDVNDWWISTLYYAYEQLTTSRGSVCSSITLQIKQTMTMTRQAFRGTLTVFNGHETEAMTDMKLNLVVSDLNNNIATAHEFQINAESLKNLEGELDLNSGWTLQPNSEGTATILFIPTKYAAPTEPVKWSFGGTLSYTDPYSGLEVTRELYPVTLTVKPSPELDLTYFMQRDVYGDDPLTKDVVEPMEDAEFALLINNKGNGDATNVKMVTQQPEITENEKGLAIDFEIVSSQVNGGAAALSFGKTIANDLGDIPAHTQCYAQWWLQSTYLGHFTSYSVEATHVTSYGNEDLSLLDQVTIHELIHGFTPPAPATGTAPARAFLVNDVEDAKDLPDQVYFTDATQQDVYIAQNATATKQNKTDYLLVVVPLQNGWNYASLPDPTAGKLKLLKITRQSDNQELPLDNIWQTSRTMRDGQEWLYEHRLHVIGEMAATGESYILTYEERPTVELDVEMTGPVYDEEFKEQGLVTDDVNEIQVKFSKPIDVTTFTAEDLKYTVQGETQDLTDVSITTEDNTNFKLDLSALNATLPNGYYVLSLQTAGIKDNEGYNGLFGRKIDWVLFRGGLIVFNATPFPLNAGEVAWQVISNETPTGARRAPGTTNSSPEYGSQIKLTATAKEGYEFVNWTLGDEVVSTEAEFITTATSDMDFVANFKKKEYMIDVNAGENGTLAGSGAGYYEYDTELTIVAQPDADFKLKGWTVNGETVATTNDTLKLTVKEAVTVRAEFVRDIYTQTLTISRGWNWLSTYMQESLAFGEMEQYADRIVAQESELFRDPEFGMVGGISTLDAGQAYKVNANTRFSRTLRGHLAEGSLELKRGWNWVAYPYDQEKTLAVIANPEEGDYIVSQTGFSEYADNQWLPAIDLTPGNGYLYKSANDKTLTFDFEATAPAGSRADYAQTAAVYSQNSTLIDVHRYPNTMNITARVMRDDMELTDQYTIYAMASDELRGVSQYVGSNHYLTVYGEGPVLITFVVENAETGDTFVADETLQFCSDVVGSRKNPFIFNIGATTGIDQLSDGSRPMTVYTLEGILVSRDATLKSLHTLPKGVYIVNGRKCYVK